MVPPQDLRNLTVASGGYIGRQSDSETVSVRWQLAMQIPVKIRGDRSSDSSNVIMIFYCSPDTVRSKIVPMHCLLNLPQFVQISNSKCQ